MRNSLIALLCLLFSSLSQAALIPTMEFSHAAPFSGFQLSPDGKAVAYIEAINGENLLRILNLETNTGATVDLVGRNRAWSHGSIYFWISDDRLVYLAKTGFEAINWDGSKGRALGGKRRQLDGGNRLNMGNVLHAFRHQKNERVIVENIDVSVRDSSSINQTTLDRTRPSVAQVSTSSKGMDLMELNPGSFSKWLINSEGEIKGAQEIKGTRYRVVYRESPKASFQALPGMDWDDPQVRPLGFGENDEVLYVSRLNAASRWAIYPYNLTRKEFGPVLLENKNYDIIPQTDTPSWSGMIFSPDKKRLLGIRYQTAYPRIFWLDQGLGGVQQALDQALRGRVNMITSMSDDLQKLVIYSRTDRDPGTYYYFDREKQALSELMKSTPWNKEGQMAKMRPIKYKARDGVLIHGYLSLPVDKTQTNLPLIVIKDGGFWSRNTWYYDRAVQFFAHRGYAVLRVNERGSSGYGDAFKRMGYQNIEARVADLADGAKWAISKGIVDADRVALLGDGSWAGLMSLITLAKDSDVWACGVVRSPRTDWNKVIDPKITKGDSMARYYERMGDPANPSDPISQLSPIQLVDEIKAPLLVVETSKTKPDYYTYLKKFVKALEDSGSTVEFNNKYKQKYGYEVVGQWWEDAAAFLEKHMPANR